MVRNITDSYRKYLGGLRLKYVLYTMDGVMYIILLV